VSLALTATKKATLKELGELLDQNSLIEYIKSAGWAQRYREEIPGRTYFSKQRVISESF